MGMLMVFWISALGFFGYILRSGITGSKADPFLVFWGISILLSTVATPVCIPTNSSRGLPFLHVLASTCCLFIYFSKILFIFRERGKEGEKEGEEHQRVVASHVPPTWDLAHKPSMCPDWESNRWPFGSQARTHSTEPHQPGLLIYWCEPFWLVLRFDILLRFWFVFLWWLVTLSIILYVYWPSVCPLWRNVY